MVDGEGGMLRGRERVRVCRVVGTGVGELEEGVVDEDGGRGRTGVRGS